MSAEDIQISSASAMYAQVFNVTPQTKVISLSHLQEHHSIYATS